eukprot:TRINITY_DN9302_c0_g1_i1.p1 TRINITY_DN9302_c0_g1~~TRINITY_DN9302_c0_g1_i1.p1  ORF type:complete len:406 (-),score=113.40 TRINITY_DN9302_c0_g1_i1:30-1247(-)
MAVIREQLKFDSEVGSSFVHGSKLALFDSENFALAGKTNIHLIQAKIGSYKKAVDHDAMEECKDSIEKEMSETTSLKKLPITSPERVTIWSLNSNSQSQKAHQHNAEIQSLSYVTDSNEGGRLGSVDALGKVNISFLEKTSSPSTETSSPFHIKNTFSVLPKNFTQTGWSGLTFFGQESNQFSVARFYEKKLSIFDEQTETRTISTLYQPTCQQISLLSSSNFPLLFTCEYNLVCVYDIRAPVARVSSTLASSSWLHCMDIQKGEEVGVSGRERFVKVFDVRKWAVSGTWLNCLKFSATSFHFSSEKDNICYVSGIDSEFLGGNWFSRPNTPKNMNSGFRGESKWIGLEKLKGKDFFVGVNESKQLHIFSEGSLLWLPGSAAVQSEKKRKRRSESGKDQKPTIDQ